MSVETLYKKSTYYITTPLYYVNDVPHIGHAYCTIAADVVARYKRLRGNKVHFLTGTDEHGQKIEKAAETSGETPKQLADRVVERFKGLWQTLNISYDDFIRTTEERHASVVAQFFKLVYNKGDIYLGEYEGWYCQPCETYYSETQLVNKKCPGCKREVALLKEESYFFRLSRYQELLLKYIQDNPQWILPEFRKNEILGMLREPLSDLSITRTSCQWGIPVPDLGAQVHDKDGNWLTPKKTHYIYVWFDALLNYISAINYLSDAGGFLERWPVDVHLVGKDIIKFHAIIWPAMLLSVGIPLPKLIYGHGFILADGEKMSKSKGNAIDPQAIIERFGVDALRFFLMREISFGQDGSISWQALENRYQSNLANDLGNLLHRSLAMLEKYFQGKVPASDESHCQPVDSAFSQFAVATVEALEPLVQQFKLHLALDEIWKLVSRANRYVDERAPWTLFKHGKTDELAVVMYNVLEALRFLALLLSPFMPTTAQRMWEALGLTGSLTDIKKTSWEWGKLPVGTQVQKGEPIFPKIELATAV